jgi:transcriptional regulator with XRE-family HTH domain
MPSRENLRATALREADELGRQLGLECRHLRLSAGLSQTVVARPVGVSRAWLSRFELGRRVRIDLRVVALIFNALGHRLRVKAFPVGEPLRDAGQVRLLARFNARIPPIWRRRYESVMPERGDMRAWDEVLTGPVSLGVDAETKPRDLQALQRSMGLKLRDSGVHRMILVVARTDRNREILRRHVDSIRQTFPLTTREVLSALEAGRDPGGNGLVVL